MELINPPVSPEDTADVRAARRWGQGCGTALWTAVSCHWSEMRTAPSRGSSVSRFWALETHSMCSVQVSSTALLMSSCHRHHCRLLYLLIWCVGKVYYKKHCRIKRMVWSPEWSSSRRQSIFSFVIYTEVANVYCTIVLGIRIKYVYIVLKASD